MEGLRRLLADDIAAQDRNVREQGMNLCGQPFDIGDFGQLPRLAAVAFDVDHRALNFAVGGIERRAGVRHVGLPGIHDLAENRLYALVTWIAAGIDEFLHEVAIERSVDGMIQGKIARLHAFETLPPEKLSAQALRGEIEIHRLDYDEFAEKQGI